ncbi:MAG: hypothetical protein ACJAT2_001612 [Bacteriovoracaceae bacterium]|jgi:hypothetical protein
MIINKTGSVFLLALFFIPSLFAANLKVGIIDTGFCGKQYKEVFNATKEDLGNICTLKRNHPRLHGQLVLEEFLKHAPKNVEVYPIVVFNKDGEQRLPYWEAAFDYSMKKKLDILLIAAGYPTKKKVSFPKFNIPSFVSSGTKEGGIKAKTYLYPQELKDSQRIFLIGSYSPSKNTKFNDAMVDSRRMYSDKIDYFFSGDSEESYLNGSSKAAATALGKALKTCPLNKLEPCLKRSSKSIKVINHDKPLPTF